MMNKYLFMHVNAETRGPWWLCDCLPDKMCLLAMTLISELTLLSIIGGLSVNDIFPTK